MILPLLPLLFLFILHLASDSEESVDSGEFFDEEFSGSAAPEPSDVLGCLEIEVKGSKLHSSINGIYHRNPELYEELPTFSHVNEKGDETSRYLWWHDYETFTRWYIGGTIGSNVAEAFRDNGKNWVNLFTSDRGDHWRIVVDEEWKAEPTISVSCAKAAAGLKWAGKPENLPNVVMINTDVLVMRNVFEHIPGRWNHGKPIYVSKQSGVFLFYMSYPNYQRWYVGLMVGDDGQVLCFVDVEKSDEHDVLKHTSGGVWAEWKNSEWFVNKEMRLVLESDALAVEALGMNKVEEQTACSVIGVGAADNDLNQEFTITNLLSDGKPMYMAENGEHIVWTSGEEGEPASWVMTFTGLETEEEGNIQAYIESDAKSLDLIDNYGWRSWDEEKDMWVEEVEYMMICNDCSLKIAGGKLDRVNGEWKINKKTHSERPVFNKGNQWLFHLQLREISRWYMTNEEGRIGSATNIIAFVNSYARSPNLIEHYAVWSERENEKSGRYAENDQIKVTGDCVKELKQIRKEETGDEGAELDRTGTESEGSNGCPGDKQFETLKDEDHAIVHWVDPAEDMEHHSIIYASSDFAPGSKFKVGKTGVAYSVIDKAGDIVRNCDFIITVVDKDPPVISCRKSIFTTPDKGEKDALVTWNVPVAMDGVDGEVEVVQVTGKKPGSRFSRGNHRIVYEAVDSKGNKGRCQFHVRIRDKEPPTVFGCPKDYTIKVYESNNWAAHPTWTPPTGNDNVDGDKVKVEQVAGLAAGEAFSLGPESDRTVIKQIYHITDKSGNVATCQFELTLEKAVDEKSGEDFKGDLATEQPQEPNARKKGSSQQRAQHFNKKKRGKESSRIQKMRKRQEERKRKAKEKKRGGHRSKKHKERIARLKNKKKDKAPRVSSAADNSSSSWGLFKVLLIIVALAALGGLLGFLYLSGSLFPKKGKRILSSRQKSKDGWFNKPKEKRFKRHRV